MLSANRSLMSKFLLFLCISFFGFNDNFVWAEKNSDKLCSQSGLQKFLDNNSIFESEGASTVLKCGKFGEILVQYAEYLENLKSNNNLSIVANYNIYEILVNKNIEHNFGILREFNKKYEYYEDDDLIFNLSKNIYLRKNKSIYESQLSIIKYIKTLRYISPHYEKARLVEYSNIVKNSKNYIFNIEKKYWNKYYGREVCDSDDGKSECMEKIVTLIENIDVPDEEQLIIEFACTAVFAYDGNFYEFTICTH